MKIIRVFPKKTRGTPSDDLAIVGSPRFFDEADEIHISVLFTWDIPEAERLAEEWRYVGNVKIGGPATGMKGIGFTPGEYVKKGYVITSRGCPNKCWFCSVWEREGHEVRELPITEGHNVLDDNLLACSEEHIRAVFRMLQGQKEPIEFSGGWEAKRLKEWHIKLLMTIRLHQVWFAYDEENDLEPLIMAGRLLSETGINRTSTGNVSHRIRCYCLVGFPGDSLDEANRRLKTAYTNGFLPMAMLWKNDKGEQSYNWRRFQKYWARPAAINRICRDNTLVTF